MDKKAFSLLQCIAEAAKDGEFVVLEKQEIMQCLPDFSDGDLEELDSKLKYLELKKYVEVKISDAKNIAVKPTSDAMLFVEIEQNRLKKQRKAFGDRLYPQLSAKKIFLMIVLGGLLGGIIASILLATFRLFILK